MGCMGAWRRQVQGGEKPRLGHWRHRRWVFAARSPMQFPATGRIGQAWSARQQAVSTQVRSNNEIGVWGAGEGTKRRCTGAGRWTVGGGVHGVNR